MISYPDALALLLNEADALPGERVDIDAASGRFLARDIASPHALPGFDNAAMDGYAVRAPGETIPADSTYAIAAMHAAGDDTYGYPDAEACEIATGARMPAGFDTVVPVERTDRQDDRVRFVAEERRGQNVRHAGSDIEAGEVALIAHRRVDPAAIMLLAALGIGHVDVVRRPRVVVINTGSELNAGGPLPLAGIHDSNGPFLASSLARWGVEAIGRTRVPDHGEAFHVAIREALAARADLIVTTGAVSAGRFDFVPAALASLGASELFHKVAIRPGKPVLAARFDHGPLVIGLPGNPIAVAVGYRFFVAPVVRAMAGLPPERPLRARLEAPQAMREGMKYFGLGEVRHDEAGLPIARMTPAQAAYRILPYTRANVWLSPVDGDVALVDAWRLDPADAS
jgi:molybdopterin molybdotransferase